MFEVPVVPGHDLQHVVVLAGQEVAFEHLRQLSDGSAELLSGVRLVVGQVDLNEAQQTEIHGVAVEQGDLPLDDASSLQLAQALLEARGGQVHLAREVHVGSIRIPLQQLQDRVVGGVEGPARGAA